MGRGSSGVRGPGAAHEQRRRDILEAVFTIVDTEGTDQVSIRRVADTAGVSLGRVQHYFPTKDDLLAEAFATINDQGADRVRGRLPKGNASDPERVLNVVLSELIPDTDSERRLVRIAQAFEVYAHTRPALKEHLTRGYDELAFLLMRLLHACVHPQDDADRASAEFHTEAYELLALATGLAGLVTTENLDARQASDIITARLDGMLGAYRRTRP
ncbi:TetR/AcrR family transcriptional regulator [Saccharomonospora sp.]|uniref:TetR/AcrR family transcriptional regulator n=1 Tax=Saccharomonospora sp. TaxID=33913 RepID=UPI00261CABD8|nr:TetR/AcrR family transcriptional regulator [Saccharomonospora sp.]